MKILILIPKYVYSNITNKRNYHYVFPLGLAYISSVLKNAGYDVDCLNLNHLDGTTADLLNRALDKKKYDVVCTGHMGIGFTEIEKIIKIVHDHKSKPKIIVGGALITSEPRLMAEELDFDYGVIGEGEITIVELLKSIEDNLDLNKVNGICYKEKGQIIFTRPREAIKNLDSLPLPDFDGFGFKDYLDNMASNDGLVYNIFDYPRLYYVLGSRGCPFHCTFCYHCLGDKYRVRSVNSIISEIKTAIKKYRINCFYLCDDLFALDKNRLYIFCREIKKIIQEIPWEFKWACQLWVGGVDKNILKLMKESGCAYISFGFESYSQEVLKSMRKPITPEQINNVISLLKELKMPLFGNFIFGDIMETKETARETLNYWKKNCDGQVQLYFIQQYPGSFDFDYCIENKIIKDKMDFIKNRMSHNVFLKMSKKMTDKEFEELKTEVFEARSKYCPHIIPLKMEKTKKDIYKIKVICPYCKTGLVYKNCFIPRRNFYNMLVHCKNCPKRFYIVSPLFKFFTNHYKKLDFLRKKYVVVHDKILKTKV